MLLSPPSNLEFPSWRAPGFDPTHPASNFNGAGASFLPASGGVYINALTGGVTTKLGVQTYGIGIAGPYVQSQTSANYNSFANSFSTTPSAITIAAIITPVVSESGGVLFQTASGSGLGLQMTIRSLVLGYRNSTLYTSGIAAMTIGVPYFVALSCNGATTYFVQVNLLTGQTLTGSIASGVSQGSTATWYLGNGGTNSSQYAGCDIHAMMAGFVALSPAQLRAWAADPWAFWYPDDDPFIRLVGRSSGALALAGLSLSRFRAASGLSGAQTMSAFTASRARVHGASSQAAGFAARSASTSGARSAAALAASFSATSSARAPSRSAATLAAAFVARSRAIYAARGATGTGAFFSATGAMKAMIGARAAASLAAALSGRSSARAQTKAAQSLAARLSASSAAGAKARMSPALVAFLAARTRAAAGVRGVFSSSAFLFAASGLSQASVRAEAAIHAARFIINPALVLKAPATIRSLAAPATTRLLKAISTIRNLKAP
jgi:hypothetical protein